jgi:ubiquinone/menaquinone biosynthesis C-methylase UbiE
VARLLLFQPHASGQLISQSYDQVAGGYDRAWTTHMRDLSLGVLAQLRIVPGSRCIDLTCGTGFVASQVATRGASVVGADASAGMVAIARSQYGQSCRFVRADAVDFMRRQSARSADVITCAWGLGYTRPVPLIREIARVLRPGGQVGIIDNTLFSLAGVLWTSVLAFAEHPEALQHVMKVQFLPGSWMLAGIMRACGLGVRRQFDGARTYWVPDGEAAIARLTATGAAAGFEFAADPACSAGVFARFARLLEQRQSTSRGIPITHRYLGAIGGKPA